jgi:uncharacterized protein YggT (Ycf19 family)
MGGYGAMLLLLADAAASLQLFVRVLFSVYTLLILAYVLKSWVRLPSSLNPVLRFLDDVCEPYLRLFRRVLPMFGPIDISPIVAVFSLVIVQRLLDGLIGRLL